MARLRTLADDRGRRGVRGNEHGARSCARMEWVTEKDEAAVLLGSMGPDVNAAVLQWASSAGMPVVGPFGGDIESRLKSTDTAFF